MCNCPSRPSCVEHKEARWLVALMTWVLSTAVVVVVLMTPAYLQKVFHIAAGRCHEGQCRGQQ